MHEAFTDMTWQQYWWLQTNDQHKPKAKCINTQTLQATPRAGFYPNCLNFKTKLPANVPNKIEYHLNQNAGIHNMHKFWLHKYRSSNVPILYKEQHMSQHILTYFRKVCVSACPTLIMPQDGKHSTMAYSRDACAATQACSTLKTTCYKIPFYNNKDILQMWISLDSMPAYYELIFITLANEHIKHKSLRWKCCPQSTPFII